MLFKTSSTSALHKQKWLCVYTWSWAQLQERSWGKILFYSSYKWWFELVSVPSVPWQKKCFGAVALRGTGKCSWLLYSTSISPVINCLRKDRLNNYGFALHSSTPMLYSQTVLEQNKAASVSVTDSYWDFIRVEVVSVLVALVAFPLFQKNSLALAFFFFFSKQQGPCFVEEYICASLALLSANIALFLQRVRLNSIWYACEPFQKTAVSILLGKYICQFPAKD